MSDVDSNLSPDGIARRDEILAIAQAAARSRRNRRSAVQFGIGVICMLGLAMAFLRTDRPEPIAQTEPTRQTAPAPTVATADSIWIQTDATIVDRLSIPRQRPRWERIGDDEFLRELADAGKPAGLAHIGDKTLLLSHEPQHQ